MTNSITIKTNNKVNNIVRISNSIGLELIVFLLQFKIQSIKLRKEPCYNLRFNN